MGALWILKLRVLRLGALLLFLLAPRESGTRPIDDTGEAGNSHGRNRACVTAYLLRLN